MEYQRGFIFFTGKYIGDKTATLIFTKDKTSVDYHYKIDLEGANEDVILSIIHQEKVISIYKIVDIVIHQKQKELTLVDSLGKEIHFISQSYIYRQKCSDLKFMKQKSICLKVFE